MTSAEEYRTRTKDIDDAFIALAGGKEGIFWRDGILDPSQYVKARYKILWVLKEPHAQDEIMEETDNFRDFMCTDLEAYDRSRWKRTFGSIVRVSHAILHDGQKDFNIDIEQVWKEVMPQIAIINVKKSPGRDSPSKKIINDAFEEYKELLTKQILGIEPDIIFECAYGSQAVYRGIEAMPHNAKVQHLYSPACRKSKVKYFEKALEVLS